MTYEQMKFCLGDYVRTSRIHERHKRELKMIETKLESVGIGIDYSKPAVKTSSSSNAAYADWITEAMFLSRQLKDEAREVQAAKKTVSTLIDTLSDTDCKDVMRYKYINDWRWSEIGSVMGYSCDWARHKCYEGIRKLAEKSTTHNHP